MKLLTDLVSKCYKYDLSITIASHEFKTVTVWDHSGIDEGEGAVMVSMGSLRGWVSKVKPEETLARMHQEVDEYINLPVYEEDDTPFDADYKTEEARAMLTEQERAMREAGMKESDFR